MLCYALMRLEMYANKIKVLICNQGVELMAKKINGLLLIVTAFLLVSCSDQQKDIGKDKPSPDKQESVSLQSRRA